jgi:hypothetical protein
MKRRVQERNIVVILFILVIITFSYAERDSRKLDQLYAPVKTTYVPLQKEKNISGNEEHRKSIVLRMAKVNY